MALIDNLIVWYEYDDSTNAIEDKHTNGYNWAPISGKSITTSSGGPSGTGKYLDLDFSVNDHNGGYDSYFHTSKPLLKVSGALTFNCWVYHTVRNIWDTYNTLIEVGRTWWFNPPNHGIWISCGKHNAYYPRIAIHTDITGGIILQHSTSTPMNEWHMLTFTYDKTLGSDNLKIYVDADLKTSSNCVGDVTFAVGTHSNYATFAAHFTGTTTASGFHGYQDLHGYWGRALSNTEITQLYTIYTYADLSGGGPPVTAPAAFYIH